MAPIRFHVLGLPRVKQGDAETPATGSRAWQLIAHLAVQRTWQSRDGLARLFWPERDPKVARSNLRNLLCKAQAAAPFLPIETTELALRLQVPGDLPDFEAAVQRGDWETALHVGAQDLLQGYEAQATEPYARWLQDARDALLARWKRMVQIGLEQPALSLLQREALAGAWSERCPLDEDAIRLRLTLALERGQWAAATQLYRDFEARLRSEFGVQPSHALVQWARQALQEAGPAALATLRPAGPGAALRQAGDTTCVDSPTRSVGGPTPAASPGRSGHPVPPALVGRRMELAQLERWLQDAEVRLITLTGPGGSGKSTLLAALHRLCAEQGREDARLIDTSAAIGAQAAIGLIAQALGVQGAIGPGAEAPLAQALGTRPCLLLLDGAEQPALQEPLALLLQRCAGLRLVVATRRRLGLEVERVVAIDGFPLPDADESEADVLASHDAVRYMERQMEQAGAPLHLARDGRTLVALIRAVEGLPLALQLLARLTPLFSLEQLLTSVLQHMAGPAAAGSPALDELMPALLASFERSWRALSPRQQTVLARLAVFPAPFDVSAARAVAQTELPVITSLVDASMVRGHGGGRLSLHAAIRACVLAVHPDSGGAEAAHAEHYTRRVAMLAALARTRSVRPLREFLLDDAAHIGQAWSWALQRRAMSTLLSLAESLWFLNEGITDLAATLFSVQQAEALLRDDPQLPAALHALLLGGMARTACFQGQLDAALAHARAALRLARRSGHRDALSLSLDTLIRAHVVLGQITRAQALVDRSAALQRLHGDDGMLTPMLLRQQGMLSFSRADWAECERLNHQVVALYRRTEDVNQVVQMLLSQAHNEQVAGRPERAIDILTEACHTAAANGVNPSMHALTWCEAGELNVELGRLEAAQSCIARAAGLAEQWPLSQYVRMMVCEVRLALALALGQWPSGRAPLLELLETLGRGEQLPMAESVFLLAARWFRQSGDREACVGLLHAIGPQTFAIQTYEAAQALLRELGAAPPPSLAPGLPTPAQQMAAAGQAHRRLLLAPQPAGAAGR